MYERAIAYCGTNLRDGHGLWDSYLEHALGRGNTQLVSEIYSKVLSVPLIRIDPYFDKFKFFVFGSEVDQVVPEGELASITAELEASGRVTADMPAARIDGEKKQVGSCGKMRWRLCWGVRGWLGACGSMGVGGHWFGALARDP